MTSIVVGYDGSQGSRDALDSVLSTVRPPAVDVEHAGRVLPHGQDRIPQPGH